ncbi:MAG: M28 family peptidase [Cyclobacteriaceae bacterium]|nr:M28 family peptidase [Cyclobacteriaceae bacterium]
MIKYFAPALLLILSSSVSMLAQKAKTSIDPPALSAILETDLKKDLYEMADPHFKGRAGGTIDEIKSAVWFAKKMQEAGLEPAGDDGTYLQFFSLWRNKISSSSTVSIGDHSLKLWKDVLVAQTAPANVTAPVVFLGKAGQPNASIDVKGKAVVIEASRDGIVFRSLPEWRYSREMMVKYGNDLFTRGAAAVIFIADEFGEHSWEYAMHNFNNGTYDLEGGPNAIIKSKPPVFWLHSSALTWIKQEGLTLKTNIMLDSFTYPSVNIVGKTMGKDPVLSKEYVLLSGHPDAHGIRNIIGNDSIYYGADDNASVNVAMLAVMRALKKVPGKRSALIVIHGAEERGLLGSRWYSAHPTVPKESIVAVLNGDMIGRNHPDSAAVMGVQSPHKNSSELAKMALDANQEGPKFKLDTLWDKPTHPEVWYFRSDHLPYARLGIPSLMYSTLLHKEYHTPQDNAQNINYSKLKKMTDWIYRTAWKVSNTDKRPAADPNFKLER